MQESFILMLAAMGAIFTTVAFIIDRETETPIFFALGMVVWFAAAGAVTVVDIPYQLENAADNSVTTGIHSVEANAPLSTLFLGLGFFCLVWLFVAGFRIITKRLRA